MKTFSSDEQVCVCLEPDPEWSWLLNQNPSSEFYELILTRYIFGKCSSKKYIMVNIGIK